MLLKKKGVYKKIIHQCQCYLKKINWLNRNRHNKKWTKWIKNNIVNKNNFSKNNKSIDIMYCLLAIHIYIKFYKFMGNCVGKKESVMLNLKPRPKD